MSLYQHEAVLNRDTGDRMLIYARDGRIYLAGHLDWQHTENWLSQDDATKLANLLLAAVSAMRVAEIPRAESPGLITCGYCLDQRGLPHHAYNCQGVTNKERASVVTP